MSSASTLFMKYLLVVFNIFFWISGVSLIVIGSVIKIQYSTYIDFLGSNFLSAPILLITVGSVIAALGFLGCCGAHRESYCMILTFSFLLGIMFMLEIAACVAFYFLRLDLQTLIHRHTLNVMKRFGMKGYEGVTAAWNQLQIEFECCGINSYEDWNMTRYFSIGLDVPDACCRDNVTKRCAEGMRALDIFEANRTIYTEGCMNQMSAYLFRHTGIMGGTAIAVSILQAVGVILACCLAKQINTDSDDKS